MTSTIAAILLQVCCDFVYRQANLCSGHSPQFIKKKLQFLAETVSEPGSSDPETSALPMIYEADVEKVTFMQDIIIDI